MEHSGGIGAGWIRPVRLVHVLGAQCATTTKKRQIVGKANAHRKITWPKPQNGTQQLSSENVTKRPVLQTKEDMRPGWTFHWRVVHVLSSPPGKKAEDHALCPVRIEHLNTREKNESSTGADTTRLLTSFIYRPQLVGWETKKRSEDRETHL